MSLDQSSSHSPKPKVLKDIGGGEEVFVVFDELLQGVEQALNAGELEAGSSVLIPAGLACSGGQGEHVLGKRREWGEVLMR